jgi:putative two-component system response regulator
MNILLLDDDTMILKGLSKALRREGYTVLTAESPSQAIALAREELVDLLICDVRMPESDGIEALGSLKQLQGGMRAIVITGYASDDAPIRAVKSGVDDYLLKPFSTDALLRSVGHSMELRRLEIANRGDRERLKRSFLQLVTTLNNLFVSRDSHFRDHPRRVASLALDLGAEMGLSAEALDRLELAALLHDVGLATVDRRLLLKAEPLSEEERGVLARHPQAARKILAGIPELAPVAIIIEHLKENYGGGGLPGGLRGQAIPMESRVLRVAEAFDALTSDRPHRPAHSVEAAIATLESESGQLFDPSVVALCAALAQENRELVDPAKLGLRADGSVERRERVQSLSVLANLFREAGQSREATQALEQAQELLGEDGDSELQVAIHIGKAHAALASGSSPQAARWVAQARHELEGQANRPARSVLDLARLFLSMDRKDTAREVLAWFPEHDVLEEERSRLELRILIGVGDTSAFQERFPLWWKEGAAIVGLGPADAREACGVLLAALRMPDHATTAKEGLAALVGRFEPLREQVTSRLPEGLSADFLPAAAAPAPETNNSQTASASSRAVLEIRLFGQPQVSYGSVAVPPKGWTTRKARELFALLAYHRRPVAAGRLEELLWPHGGDGTRTNLHTTVSRARRALRQASDSAPNVVSAEGDFYSLDATVSQWVDTREFESLAQQVLTGDDQGALSAARERSALACLALYQGDFLEGIWEEWTFQPRTSFAETWFALQQRLGEHYLVSDNVKAAEHCYREMLSRDALREEAHVGLMRAALRAGRRDQVVERYHSYKSALGKDMGMEPSAEAQRVYLEAIDQKTP